MNVNKIENFYEYLLNKYGRNKPILLDKIEIGKYSKPWLFKQLKKLVDEKKILKYAAGIYYIPEKTPFGYSLLNPRDIIETKYIGAGSAAIGYYTGLTLCNEIGITNQVPNIIEVVTNIETTRVRRIKLGKLTVILRRPRVEVTSENVRALQFLELMNIFDYSEYDNTAQLNLKRFIRNAKLSLEEVSKYASYFPSKAMRNLMKSGAIYEIA